jgi:thiol-disulfide isomerase/thioredoxin
MANGVPRTTNPPGAVLLDPVVLTVGGAVALVGVIVVAIFVWMVPHAASREVAAACRAMRSDEPNAALCQQGKPCKWPMQAPDFTAYDYQGKPVHLSDFRGKVVLLNFWASWCGVCATEKPQLAGMAEDLTSDKFVVVTLASDHSWSTALLGLIHSLARDAATPASEEPPLPEVLAAYQQALPNGVPFQVFLDRPAGDENIGQIARSWGIKAVPESALIDRDGNIRAYYANKRDWESSVAETCLQALIDED